MGRQKKPVTELFEPKGVKGNETPPNQVNSGAPDPNKEGKDGSPGGGQSNAVDIKDLQPCSPLQLAEIAIWGLGR